MGSIEANPETTGGNPDPEHMGDSYTVYWSVNGSILHTTSVEANNYLSEIPDTPTACDGYGYMFAGWTTTPISGSQTWPPSIFYYDVNQFPSVSQDITYYAVFNSIGTGGGTYEHTDVLTRELTNVSSGSSTYSDWTYFSETSNAKYAGNSAGGNNAIQLRSSNNNSGIVTTVTGGIATMITIEWQTSGTSNSSTINVYGKNSAYSSPTDLYGSELGTIIGTMAYDGSSTSVLNLNDGNEYEYIGLRSASGAVYLTSVSIVWRTSGAGDVSEYITSCGSSGGNTGDPWGNPDDDPNGDPIGRIEPSGELPGGQTWTLRNGNELYIEGGGTITGYNSLDEVPWVEYSAAITSIYLNADFISIGSYVFMGLTNLTSITCTSAYVPTLQSNTFSETTLSSITAYVRESMKPEYQQASYWNQMTLDSMPESGGMDDSNPISGYLGDNSEILWTLMPNSGVLTISGTGEMPDYESEWDVPWYEYAGQVNSVIVSEGVTYIGNNAFMACTNLTQATFPRTTDSIGVNIFYNPNQSFRLNLGAFFPPAITQETFGNVSGQLYIYVWQSLWGLYLNTPIWMNLMINSNSNPTDIDAMDVIDNEIVWYVSEEVLHFRGRGSIPDYSEAPEQPWYEYRSGIYKIYMNSSSITQIGSYAFEGCSAVNEVVLPGTLTYAGYRAFGDCTGLVELNTCAIQSDYGIACDADAFVGVSMSGVTVRVPSSTQQEAYSGTEIFSDCMFELCESSGDVEDKILDSGECGPEVYWELYESGKLIIKGNSYIYGYTYYEDIPWYNYRSQINSVEVREGVQSLTDAAFIDCIQMSDISLPSSLCCIGDSTFFNCVALRSITCIRDNPPSVNGEYPFGGVTLSNITLYVPEGASTMYSYADYWKEMTIEELSGGSVLEPYQLQAIFVNNIGLSDFSPDIYTYDISLPANSGAPYISYMSGNINQTIEVEQPASANSTGYIHVSVDGERKATYSLNFSCEITQVVIPLSHAWQFIMLPSMFGLGENDITNDAEVEWARYDGEKRAAGQSGWTIVDFAMSYYKDWGHIVRASGDSATITIQLPQNLNSRSATIHLYKYASSHEENKNWCLIGNPYNAEYRLEGFKAAGINSPIAVWNGIGYNTYDPEFDEYVIQPFEAFFVQLPDDAPEQITLQPEYVVGYENGSNTGNDSDEGALNGFFSVGEGVQVRFSKGNLQYYPLKDVWQFAENQYDTIGIANANISADYDGWIDLFGWGTGANPTLATQNAEDYAVFTDWGNNPINNGGYMEGLWRTLTSDEWNYLFTSRNKASRLYGVASVNGVNGMILLPDGWYEGSQPIAITTGTGEFTQNTLTISDWEQLESAGAVFLPAMGYRSVTGVNSAGTYGLYWSATPNGTDNAYRLNFGSDYYDAQDYNNRNYGYSVRLVR